MYIIHYVIFDFLKCAPTLHPGHDIKKSLSVRTRHNARVNCESYVGKWGYDGKGKVKGTAVQNLIKVFTRI